MSTISKKCPLVSVAVITYNSSRTVLDTLESIKAQTYPNIELIISDDCSKDETVALCQEWVERNKERFTRTEIVTIDNNKGVSANVNRAEDACTGEWMKGIAGDDLLMPNCIYEYINYVADKPDVIYIFSRCKAFGANEELCKRIDTHFDYDFFTQTPEMQLRSLIYKGNCVPATTSFYNLNRIKALEIRNDERIPLLDDWPRWINLLRAGVKFHFINKVLVQYRVGGISTVNRAGMNAYKSSRLFCFLYQYPEWVKEDPEKAVERVIKEEMDVYNDLLLTENELKRIKNSNAYKIGKMLLKPFKWLKH